jgi:NADPH-dependent curcumin reductase CurA
MAQLKEGARIALSGAISEYEGEVEPLFNSYELVTKRVRMEGFMVTDHVEDFPAILKDLQNRLADGTLKSFEQIYNGLSETPRAFCDMMHGASRGKCLVTLD